MELPNLDRAVIDASKLRDYVLSVSHPVGRFKARFFRGLGYTSERWREFEQDLRRQHLALDAEPLESTEYGQKFAIRGILRGPTGRSADVVSVWIILGGEDFPQFITAYPGARQ